MAPQARQIPTALTDSTLPHHHLHACPKNFQHVRRSFSTSHPSDNKGLFWLSDFLSVWSFPVNQRLLSRPLQLPACLLAFDCLWPKYAMLPLPALETPPAAALPFAALSLLLFYAGWLRFNAFGHKFARKSTMHARFLTSDSFFSSRFYNKRAHQIRKHQIRN